MPRDFFPFVEEGEQTPSQQGNNDQVVAYPARIAVYEDPSVTPRVIIIEPTNVRDFLANITEAVSKLAREQGGTIPFTIIRELVENFIHASFIEPTITILDGGSTIRFCDQGPGIREKSQALQFGTTSATEDMKRYIRGVGSGLPIAQQYMIDKGGSLTIQDNINGGTIVTISSRPYADAEGQLSPHPINASDNGIANQPTQQGHCLSPDASFQPGCQPHAIPYPIGTYQQQPQTDWPIAHQLGMSQFKQEAQPHATFQGFPQNQVMGQAAVSPQVTPVAAAQGMNAPMLSPRGTQILSFLSVNQLVGPNDLVQAFGGSSPTWSRELKTLDEKGLTHKDGQKRRLTEMGLSYLRNLG